MKINKVTITGADDKVDPLILSELTEQYPFVEWGILFSMKSGATRYPSANKIKQFKSLMLPMSGHFCGWYSRAVLEGKDFRPINEVSDHFGRIQLNYNFSRNDEWALTPLFNYAKQNPSIDIILQWNKSNGKYLSPFVEAGVPKNINFLYDSSGGRGVEIQDIEHPLSNYTGYSGGLNPENLKHVIELIQTKVTDRWQDSVWIDMESGVRTNDEFDVDKVKKVLSICKEFISDK